MNKKLKLIVVIVTSLFLVLGWIFGKYFYSSYVQEQESIKIDEYNFKQLEKVKKILDWLDPYSYKFKNFKEFNVLFNSNVEAINNCYYLADIARHYDVWQSHSWWYIFWFYLNSKKYSGKYKSHYYIYPSYNLPKIEVYLGDESYDIMENDFYHYISNPCEELKKNWLKFSSFP